MKKYTSIQEIKEAVKQGKTVNYKSGLYIVKIDFEGDLIVKCTQNASQELLTESFDLSDFFKNAKNPDFLKAENFDIKITKIQAEYILINGVDGKKGFDVMCKEYGDDDDWCGVTMDDLNEDCSFDAEYQTFEIWLNDKTKKEQIQEFINNLKIS